MKARHVLFLFVVLAVTACGSEADSGPGELPDPVCISEVGTPTSDFVGLSEDEATELAEERDLQVRVVGRDGECFPVTEDLRNDRVNLELVDDVVVGAAIY